MGRAKALLPHPRGGTFVEHVVGVARTVAAEVVLLGEGAKLPESLRNSRVLADSPPGTGPLGGLRALLDYAAPRWGLLLSCDLANLAPALLEKLCASVAPEAKFVGFRATTGRGGFHTCCALYHPDALPIVRAQLQRGDLRMQNLIAALPAVALAPNPAEEAQLMNFNSVEDLARLIDGDPNAA